ncbi:MAG: Mannosylglycerate hydrolase [Promethearchaeota archaeon]|nr:MAG: Mannosylglycerate hydrolase [Candidatus Lokiarchaeota archaeon]
MKTEKVVLVPETHWDREWYLPFQEFRAKLVIMMDKLLNILKTNPNYSNFTFDGQTIPIEDYLEVKPYNRKDIEGYVKQNRLSMGPFYVLPDEFLVSGESLIRNLMIGHEMAQKFGRVMKAGYIPDPFGHIAQLPQILRGFEIPSVLFWRGFGDEFEQYTLNMEFNWEAPGNATSILAIHLISSYGSLAKINTKKTQGRYKKALRAIKRVISKLEKHTATPYILLNNGSDHDEAQPEIPIIVKEWNEEYPHISLVQEDFEYYINKVLEYNPQLKSYCGELRGGRYAHLLSGVFSARMWIKQRNTKIEYLYEKYAEPLSAITWTLDQSRTFDYPSDYLLTGLKWLIKNHPHDSICGCSIDQVHEEMITRFDWAEQIACEIVKNSSAYLERNIQTHRDNQDLIPLLLFNPLPWKRNAMVTFDGITPSLDSDQFPANFQLRDYQGTEIPYQGYLINQPPRYDQESDLSKRFTFQTDIPACGYKMLYIDTSKKASHLIKQQADLSSNFDENIIENQYYKVKIITTGHINVLDKESNTWYENVCFFEDVGDWGDEYDFSGPDENQTDVRYTSNNATVHEIKKVVDGPTQHSILLRMSLKLPTSLTKDRKSRTNELKDNEITITISLYNSIRRIDFKVDVSNNCKDHRLRALFPSNIKTEKVYADGHFYVVPRNIELPEAQNWVQKPLPTNHQKDFVSISSKKGCFSVINRGLPEYEAIVNEDGTITMAITLLRCIEWLSRDDFKTRKSHAGPKLRTPNAQCLGTHEFELSLTINGEHTNWQDTQIYKIAKEVNNPIMSLFPSMIKSNLRMMDKVVLNPSGILSLYVKSSETKKNPYLPPMMSFLEIDNTFILLSALKKAEKNNTLILRVYNISDTAQDAQLKFFDALHIKNLSIVNFLEEPIKYSIKGEVKKYNTNKIQIHLGPHVILTFQIEFELTT